MHKTSWSRQLYSFFKVKPWNFTERDFSKDLTCSSKVKYMKIYPDIVIKISKITSLSQYWRLHCQLWKFFCFLRLVLETTTQVISQNLKSFQEKYLGWSSVIFKQLPLRLTVILLVFENYDSVEPYYDLWSFIPDLGLFSTISQFERYIITFIGNTFTIIVNRISYFYSSTINPIYETTLNYSLLSNNILSNNRT